MAIRTDQVIGPITLPTTGVIEHDSEPDNQQGVDRLPQVARIMVLLISARPSRDDGVEPALAGFIQNAWKPSTRTQYAAVWKQ